MKQSLQAFILFLFLIPLEMSVKNKDGPKEGDNIKETINSYMKQELKTDWQRFLKTDRIIS